MGLDGLAVPGHAQKPSSGLRRRIDSAISSRTFRRAAAIGNLAAMGCIGLSFLPKAVSDPHQVLAGMSDPAGTMMPWLLVPRLVTSAIASTILLMASSTATANVAEPRSETSAKPDARHDLRLDRIGHELRTPLTAIIGFSDMMQRELHGPIGSDRYQCYVEHIRESGVTLLQVIEVAMTTAAAAPEPGTTISAGAPKR